MHLEFFCDMLWMVMIIISGVVHCKPKSIMLLNFQLFFQKIL